MTADHFLAAPARRRYRELVFAFTRQNVQNRYRGSALGVLWSLLNPLAMTAIYVTIFGNAFRSAYSDSGAQYGISVFIGLLVVNFFTQSTTLALGSIVANGSLLQKIRVPFSIFPVSSIATHIVQFALASLPILVVATAFESRDLVHVLLLVVPLVSLAMLSLGVGMLTSAGYVFFRDLPYIYEVAAFVIWVTSPVFYPISIVPAGVRPLLELNPLYAVLASTRELALGSQAIDFPLLALALLEGVASLSIGYAAFALVRRRFMDSL